MNPVEDLSQRVERLTTADLAASHEEGRRAGVKAAEGIGAGRLRRGDFVAAWLCAAARAAVHDHQAFAYGFFEAVHSVLLRVPVRRA